MTDLVTLFHNFSQLPIVGKKLFSQTVSFRAPYFATIAPQFLVLEPGRIEVAMKNRRSVHNHIGTVHAIAVCNLCEAAAGVLIEASLPKTLRWIPHGIHARYLKKADTDLLARASMDIPAADFEGDLNVVVQVFNTRQEVVTEAEIPMYVTLRKANRS
jgi:acyl-coenzyme A thioesterase PaaI-like protein